MYIHRSVFVSFETSTTHLIFKIMLSILVVTFLNSGNVFNRLVIFDARLIHSAGDYFGHNIETGRLFQMFFFDARTRSAFDAEDGAGKK